MSPPVSAACAATLAMSVALLLLSIMRARLRLVVVLLVFGVFLARHTRVIRRRASTVRRTAIVAATLVVILVVVSRLDGDVLVTRMSSSPSSRLLLQLLRDGTAIAMLRDGTATDASTGAVVRPTTVIAMSSKDYGFCL